MKEKKVNGRRCILEGFGNFPKFYQDLCITRMGVDRTGKFNQDLDKKQAEQLARDMRPVLTSAPLVVTLL